MVKLLKMLIKLSIGAMTISIIIGGIIFFSYTNRFAKRLDEMQEENKILKERHIHEISDTPDKLRIYTNTQGINVIIDNYLISDDTITIDFTLDTSDFEVKEDYEISDDIITGKKHFGLLTAGVLIENTDMDDETFYKSFTTENFMMNYNLYNHFDYLSYSFDSSNEYGYLISSENNYKKIYPTAFFYDSKRKFTLVLNADKVSIIKLSFNYTFLNSESSTIYMLIQ